MSAFLPTTVSASGAPSASPVSRASRRAFTLIELLVVMGVIVLMVSIVTPAFTSLRNSGDFTSQAARIAGTLEQARAYAMANNTYVYVGMGEYLVTEPSSANPRTSGNGELAVAAYAARNGTRGYDVSNPSAWATNYGAAGNGATLLVAIDKLALYDNIHLADFGGTSPASGNMLRPAVTDSTYRLGASTSVTPLAWPLGVTLAATAQYYFTKVIQFDPQGVARIQTSSNTDTIAPWMEIDLQPTHGTVVPGLPSDQNVGNQAAILVDCMTGAVRMYRP